MSLDQEFQDAQKSIKTLTKRPDSATLLKLYSLYKQGTDGDVSGKRPGTFDFKGRAKYDAWAALKGTSSDDAKTQYTDLVKSLVG